MQLKLYFWRALGHHLFSDFGDKNDEALLFDLPDRA